MRWPIYKCTMEGCEVYEEYERAHEAIDRCIVLNNRRRSKNHLYSVEMGTDKRRKELIKRQSEL